MTSDRKVEANPVTFAVDAAPPFAARHKILIVRLPKSYISAFPGACFPETGPIRIEIVGKANTNPTRAMDGHRLP